MSAANVHMDLDKVIARVGTIDAETLRRVKARLNEVENALVLERSRVQSLEEALRRARFTPGA